MTHPDPAPVARFAAGAKSRTLFDTRSAFTEHLQDALSRAQREVWLADRDFADWPLANAAFTATLQAFLRASAANQLRILTLDAERIASSAPRFIEVVRPHSITAQCRVVPPHAAARFGEACSMMIVDRSLLVRRFHRDHLRGAAEFDPAAARPWLDQFETLWEESAPALAATTLGLG
jgi:hypothetical protein